MALKRDESSVATARKSKTPRLFMYAFCGDEVVFTRFIEELSNLAEKEKWQTIGGKPFDILRFYIFDTFCQCELKNLIFESNGNEFSIFNTGLMTVNGEDIYGLFQLNERADAQKWFFKGFYKETDRTIVNIFSKLPTLATYTSDYTEYYFDTNKDILLNIDHILDNWDRYDDHIKNQGREVVKALIQSAFETAKKKVKRNNRLVVPQYYRNRIMYLMPIEIPVPDNGYITMALAIEKLETGLYRANTIFTTEMAYGKARLIMKPESNWLL